MTKPLPWTLKDLIGMLLMNDPEFQPISNHSQHRLSPKHAKWYELFDFSDVWHSTQPHFVAQSTEWPIFFRARDPNGFEIEFAHFHSSTGTYIINLIARYSLFTELKVETRGTKGHF